MGKLLGLSSMKHNTLFAPLVALGWHLRTSHFFDPLFEQVGFDMKTVVHEPHQKLLEVLVSILADCHSISQINTRLLPERALAEAWGCAPFAEQSLVARLLDSFTDAQVEQLRGATHLIYLREGQGPRHDFAQGLLTLDCDLSGLPASPHAQGSEKGFFSGKKTARGGNWCASAPPLTTRLCSRRCAPATKAALPRSSPPC